MSDYRRWFVPGGIYFLTIVTYGRRPILTTQIGRSLLRASIQKIRSGRPFELLATVLMPNHWHLILSLPPGDRDYSSRIKRIKEEFTRGWLSLELSEVTVTQSQSQRGERGVWQPRFWEHTIREEADLESCVDYIHWNPRKHGLVARVKDWPWSSFHRFVQLGHYDSDWGGCEPKSICIDRDWGE